MIMLDPLQALAEQDLRTKPSGADNEWRELTAYYEDQSRSTTRSHLISAGVGLGDNQYPIDLGSLLKRLIDGAATIYNQPPARFLVRGPRRLSEAGTEHKEMLRVLDLAQFDVAMREADRYRTLLGQVCLRFYPDDTRGGVVVRKFLPQSVRRNVDPARSDLMDQDESFSLELSGDVVEFWHKAADGGWLMEWREKDGPALPMARQPFRETALRSPYARLPVQMVYSDYTGGEPWIAPRQSRQGYLRTCTSIANGIHELQHLQAHNTIVYLRRNPNNTLPAETGAGAALTIDADEDIKALSPSPMLEQSLSVVQRFLRFFAASEYQPGDEFDPDQNILTGAAQRVKLGPLYDRREDQIPLAGPDEANAWERIRAVHNVHAPAWNVASLAEDTDLEIEIRNMSTPTTETEEGNQTARQLALGSASMIDVIMRENSCTRAEAIERYDRVLADSRMYPPMANPGAEQEGPRMASVDATPGPTAPDEQPDAALDGKPSVVSRIGG
jgi:hypothetical protein